jgi:type I restriction enzyme, S subunit
MTSNESNEWRIVKLKEVIQFNPRETIKTGTLAKKIGMDKLQTFQRKIIGYEIEEYKSGTKFRNGDTLLARITPCLENGKTAQVDILEKDEVAFGSTEFIVLREIAGKSINDFIYYLSISPKFREIAIKSMTGTTGRQRAQKEVLENSTFHIPPLDEQKAIANILSSLDEKIETNNQINKKLEEMAQAIFKHWFVDFEFPNENGEPYKSSGGEMVESEIGMIPKGWKIQGLDEIADFLNGLAMQKFRPQEDEKSLPVLKIRELRQGFTDNNSDECSENIERKYIVDDGDIIFSWSGSLLVDIWCGGKCGLNQHLFKVTSQNNEKWFYYHWIRIHLERFIRIAESKATTMGHIKRKDLSDAKVLIPSEDIYLKANKIFKPIFEKIVNIKVESKKLREIRDILLPKLMSGEIRVPLES